MLTKLRIDADFKLVGKIWSLANVNYWQYSSRNWLTFGLYCIWNVPLASHVYLSYTYQYVCCMGSASVMSYSCLIVALCPPLVCCPVILIPISNVCLPCRNVYKLQCSVQLASIHDVDIAANSSRIWLASMFLLLSISNCPLLRLKVFQIRLTSLINKCQFTLWYTASDYNSPTRS